MMGKTHLAVGIAASLLVTQPQTASQCIVSLIGGAAGGILADIDILDNKSHDSLKMQFACMGMTFALLMLDSLLHLGVCDSILANGYQTPAIGLGAFSVLWIIGVFTGHRTFTHSILAGALYSACVWVVYPPLMYPFAVGYISHLALDLLNRKNIPLFFPLKAGVCLRLCYADSFASKLLFRLGMGVSVVYLGLWGIQLLLSVL